MKKRVVIFLFFSVLAFKILAQEKMQKPNIIFILADDLGYMDLGGYATKVSGTPTNAQFYETPHIDKMMKEGVSFSQAYANPLCSPTRASLITGKYASKLGFMTATAGSASTPYNRGEKPAPGFTEQNALWGDKIPFEQALINGYTNIVLPSGQPQDNGVNEITLAEALKGYTSAFLGKWHLGGHGSEGYQPRDQGFKEIAYFDSGSSPFYNWRGTWDNKNKKFPKMRQNELMQGFSGKPTGKEYLTEDLTEQAVDFIDEQANSKEKKPFFLYYCEFAVHAPLQAPQASIDYFNSKPTKGWNGHANATYAAMIKSLDESVGRIFSKLKETGLDENTLVIFMSDNGGISYDAKYAQGLTTSNAPLKGGKATVFEGGIRVPLVFWQKGKVKAGKWSDVPVHCNDIFPTLLDMVGQQPQEFPNDGMSIKSLLKDTKNKKKKYTRNTFYWHYPLNVSPHNPDDDLPLTPHSAIRKGDYKLIFDWHGRLKLYNIKEDISEKNNLAFSKPDITRDLFANLINWLEANVEKKYFPTLNAEYNAAKEPRKEPFVDLYSSYKAGKDIVLLAH
jgi:arylsulfatase A-like enzyme